MSHRELKQCPICSKFVGSNNFARHKKIHQFQCSKCSSSFAKEEKLSRHFLAKHSTSSFVCSICNLPFLTFNRLSYHKRQVHGRVGKIPIDQIDLSEFGEEDPKLLEELRSVQHFLVDSKLKLKKKTIYNFRLTEFNPILINEKLREVFLNLNCAVKLNLSFGFVLHDRIESGEYRYYYAADNNPIFQTPITLENESDLLTLQSRIEQENFLHDCVVHRPNTKWKFALLTNLTVFLYHLEKIPLGCSVVNLPQAIIKNPNIRTFLVDGNKKPYDDNLCFFRAVAFEVFGKRDLVTSTNSLVSTFLSRIGKEIVHFKGIQTNEIQVVENIIGMNISLFSISFDEQGNLVGTLSYRSLMSYEKSFSLLQYDNHVCWVKNIDQFLKKYRCDHCDKFFPKVSNYQRHLTVCTDRVSHRYPKRPYQLKETIFEKLTNLEIPVQEFLYENLVVFDFESITVPDSTLPNSEMTRYIGKHVPISVSIFSNLLSEPIFICNSDPRLLVSKFIEELVILSQSSSQQLRQLFQKNFEALDEKLQINECSSDDSPGEDKNSKKEKNLLLQVKTDLIVYCDNLPVFGFNSSRYDLNLIKEPLLDILLNDYQCTPSVIKVCNKYIGMNFLGLQFMDILNFLGGATSLDKFLKAYGASEEKGFFPYEWLDTVEKLEVNQLPDISSFYSELKKVNVLEVDQKQYNELLSRGICSKDALKKLGLSSVPKGKEENYEELQKLWEREKMQCFKDYLKWYNNKDVVPTLEALQKMLNFYHSQNIDMLKLGLTLPNLSNRILHSTTTAKFFPFNETDKIYDDYIRSWLTGGPSIIFTRYAKVGETRIRNSNNVCRSIVGIDASQLYPFSMTKDMPTGVYTKWEMKTETGKFHPRRNQKNFLECVVLEFLQIKYPNCKLRTQFNHKSQKRIGKYLVDGYCSHCRTVFEVLGCYWHFCNCQDKNRLSLSALENGAKRRKFDEVRRIYLTEADYNIKEVWECEWWKQVRENVDDAGDFMRQCYPYQNPLTESEMLEDIKTGRRFGVIDCSIEVPCDLRAKFDEFPPIFKNFYVGLQDIGPHMRDFAEKNHILKKPRRLLISSFHLSKGPLITPLLQFYLEKGLVVSNVTWFIEYTPRKCFKSFVDTVVEARREGDKNKNSSVVAETMKLIANSSYGYQIMDRSRHTTTKYANEEKVNKLINESKFKSLNVLSANSFEVELIKPVVEHKEPIIVGFFILQYAKLTMLQLYYSFFQLFCDPQKFELIEMDTDSLYMALAGETLADIIKPEMKLIWDLSRQDDCRDDFAANGHSNFFPRNCCNKHWVFDQRTPGLFKEEFRCTEMVALCSKTYCCFDSSSNTTKLSCKGLNKHALVNDEPLQKYRKVLQKESVVTTNRGFRVVKNSVATYDLKMNGLSYFYPKRQVLSDGIHTKALDI